MKSFSSFLREDEDYWKSMPLEHLHFETHNTLLKHSYKKHEQKIYNIIDTSHLSYDQHIHDLHNDLREHGWKGGDVLSHREYFDGQADWEDTNYHEWKHPNGSMMSVETFHPNGDFDGSWASIYMPVSK